MNMSGYPEWEKQSRLLTKEEIDNPHLVIEELFDFAHLPEIRNLLWEWLKTTVTGDFNESLDAREKSSLLFLYEKIQKLIEASHILLQIQRKEVVQEQEKSRHIF